MIKGIQGHGYYDELVVPIIENTAREYELTDSLAAAVRAPAPSLLSFALSAYASVPASSSSEHAQYVFAQELGDGACNAMLPVGCAFAPTTFGHSCRSRRTQRPPLCWCGTMEFTCGARAGLAPRPR